MHGTTALTPLAMSASASALNSFCIAQGRATSQWTCQFTGGQDVFHSIGVPRDLRSV